ncbi:bone morphogenetic protein 6-like [Lytechinus pictus]|uniref:bone morphogenetic protein 6-like n=1 Tax=Lytechinus pictus TaxID=7653 RepID=UPI0030B9B028
MVRITDKRQSKQERGGRLDHRQRSRSSGRKTFEFEIRGILDRETIVSAEIVLYKRQSRTSSWEPIPSEDKRAIIEVYHVYRLERKGDVRRRKTLVDQRIIHLSYSGLLQFNVTSAFLNKAQSVRLTSDNTSVMTRTFEVKVRARSALIKRMVRFIKFPADNRPEKQPLLVLYLNDNMIQRRDIAMPLGTEGVVAPRRSSMNRLATHSDFTASNRLETRLQNSIELERRLEVAAAVEENSRTDNSGVGREHKALRRKRRAENRASGRPGRTKCQLEQYEVNFEDIGWTTWIVAPRTYHSNFCEGYCPFPLDSHFNGTNHAAVQAILHTRKMKRRDGRRIPSPCCVPNSFTGLSVLYLNNEKNVVIKDFEQMVATSCGCH